MTSEKYIELNLNDEKAGKVAEVLSNKTAKKILGLLAEEELSQGDIAKKLKTGLNNVDYNIKKLIESGLVEKTSSFFWSVKGKKIPTYTISNKKIIISTKNSFKGVVLSGIFGGLVLGGIKLGANYYNQNFVHTAFSDGVYESAPVLMAKTSETISFIQTSSIFSDVLIYIVVGLVIGALGYVLYQKMKGGFNKI